MKQLCQTLWHQMANEPCHASQTMSTSNHFKKEEAGGGSSERGGFSKTTWVLLQFPSTPLTVTDSYMWPLQVTDLSLFGHRNFAPLTKKDSILLKFWFFSLLKKV